MTIEVDDLLRELGKIEDTLSNVKAHLASKDSMNASLHMSPEVRHTPLYSAVANAYATCINLRNRIQGEPQDELMPHE